MVVWRIMIRYVWNIQIYRNENISEDIPHKSRTLALKNEALTMNLIRPMVISEARTDRTRSRANTMRVLRYIVVYFDRCRFKGFRISIESQVNKIPPPFTTGEGHPELYFRASEVNIYGLQTVLALSSSKFCLSFIYSSYGNQSQEIDNSAVKCFTIELSVKNLMPVTISSYASVPSLIEYPLRTFLR